ncbi:MAG: response regulator [Vicinamibacterales bacterium]
MTAKHILLVEDNQDDVELTLRAFRRSEIVNSIHVVRDGREALDWLHGDAAELPGGLPTVILLDLHLPKIDGLEVLRRIRADSRTSLLPVVILTSSDEPSDLLDGYRLGANSFVRKPVAFGDLIETARQIGLYWLGLNEVPSPLTFRRVSA